MENKEKINLTKYHKDLSGQRFGQLVCLYPIGMTKSHNTIWLCQCDCGNYHEVINTDLTRGRTKRCWKCSGKKHHTKQIEDRDIFEKFKCVHNHLLAKCIYRNRDFDEKYYKYIDLDSSRINIYAYKLDIWESNQKHIEEFGVKNTTLDRIDNKKGYSKFNCRWATLTEQVENRRNQKRFKVIYPDGRIDISNNQRKYAREHNISLSAIHSAIKTGKYVTKDNIIIERLQENENNIV